MRYFFGFILLIALCFSTTVYAQKNKTIVGTISGFECGDNCYLTITDKKGKEHQALCLADLCETFATATDDNLAGYKGKMVKVSVGKGNQVDGAENVMGVMDAFLTIELIK
jgi:hypothetical protein